MKALSIIAILVLGVIGNAFAGIAQVPAELTNGLVNFYAFNGNANDSVGSDNGTLVEGLWTNDQSGRTNSAYYFGDLTGLQTQGIAGEHLNTLRGNFSCSLWFKATGSTPLMPEAISGTAYEAVHKNINSAPWSYNNSGIGLSAGINGFIVFEYAHQFIAPVLVYPSSFESSWVNAVITVSNDGAPTLYINGQYVRGALSTGRVKMFTFLPLMSSGYGRFTGSLNDVGIWNRALTADEVLTLYKAQSPVYEVTLTTKSSTNLNEWTGFLTNKVETYNPTEFYKNDISVTIKPPPQ